ncbi:fimbria/pilus periplasmic chaperone [Enterobacter sp. JBIWA008]|uniref:fimbria/pilus periplasmic chaperone n=1 Tax=Enterobacter sp. JBIWA008 TaxID=2831892 RepID=UPI0032B75229
MKSSRRATLTGLTVTLMLLSGTSLAEEQKINTNTKSFSVKLGATRIVYNPDSSGATLPVINPQDYPILVQTQVYGEDKQSKAPYMVTPPLFRLDGNQQSRVRVVRTGGGFPQDRESLSWVCITGVPPKPEDVWGQDKDGKTQAPKEATLEVQLRINSCIKLFLRPSSIKGDVSDSADKLTWKRDGGHLKVINPTPYYMNLKDVKVGGRKVENLDYIAPRGEKNFSLPAGASGLVQWKVITDYGGDSRDFQATLQ